MRKKLIVYFYNKTPPPITRTLTSRQMVSFDQESPTILIIDSYLRPPSYLMIVWGRWMTRDWYV